MKRDVDHVQLSRLLDEGLDRPREDRRRWLEQLPPEHAALKPRLARMLLTQLRDEADDLLAVARLIRMELLDLAAIKGSMRLPDEVARREKLLAELIHQYQDILRDTFRD